MKLLPLTPLSWRGRLTTDERRSRGLLHLAVLTRCRVTRRSIESCALRNAWELEGEPSYLQQFFGNISVPSTRLKLLCFDLTVLTDGPKRQIGWLKAQHYSSESERMNQMLTVMKNVTGYTSQNRKDILEREQCIVQGRGVFMGIITIFKPSESFRAGVKLKHSQWSRSVISPSLVLSEELSRKASRPVLFLCLFEFAGRLHGNCCERWTTAGAGNCRKNQGSRSSEP